MCCSSYHLYFSKSSPLILSNKGHRFREKDELLLHCQALGPTVSASFIPSSPNNEPSPEAWYKCEAQPERRASSISSCYLSEKRSLLFHILNTCTTGFDSTSSLNCLFQSDDPASNANSYLFWDLYLECSYLINMLTNSRPYLIASKGGNLIMCTCSVS